MNEEQARRTLALVSWVAETGYLPSQISSSNTVKYTSVGLESKIFRALDEETRQVIYGDLNSSRNYLDYGKNYPKKLMIENYKAPYIAEDLCNSRRYVIKVEGHKVETINTATNEVTVYQVY